MRRRDTNWKESKKVWERMSVKVSFKRQWMGQMESDKITNRVHPVVFIIQGLQ